MDMHCDRTGVQRGVRARGDRGGCELDALGEPDISVEAAVGVVAFLTLSLPLRFGLGMSLCSRGTPSLR